MTAPETEFIQAGELRFEVLTCGDPAAERLALCLHGFPEHPVSWRHQMPILADLGYRVWAPSQRGYGATSPRPGDVAAYHVDHLVADVAALFDASGARSLTLIAHDWGALVAWIFALRGVRPVERLAIFNVPHPGRFLEHLRTNRRQRLRSWYERFFQIPWLPERLLLLGGGRALSAMFTGQAVHPERFPPDILDVFVRQALAPGAMTAMLHWYRANPFRQVCDEAWPVLEVPTLMVWGAKDQALGVEMTFGTEKLVRDLTIRYMNASHWVQQDVPEQCNAVLSAWLTGGEVPELEPAPALGRS